MRIARFQLDLSPVGRGRKVYLLLGTLLGLYGGYRMYLTSLLVAGGQAAQARVVYMDHRLRTPDDPIDPWHKEARFSRRAFRTVVFTAGNGLRVVDQPWISWDNYASKGLLSPKRIPQERTAAILYDPSQPARWLFDDITSLWLTPSVCMCLGAALLLFAAAVQQGWIVPPKITLLTKVPHPASGAPGVRVGHTS